MATGRTLLKWTRFYMAGYDLSGYARTPGPLTWEYEESDLTGMSNDAMGYLPGKATITPSALNGNLDNTATSGLHVVASSPGSGRVVTIPIGIRAAPGPGDPVFVGKYQQVDYSLDPTSAYVNITFDEWDASGLIAYDNPWGVMLHAASAETAVNSAAGIDDNGGATTQGGYLVYQVLAGNGTATIKVQDAAVNADGSFSDLSGATTGVIDCANPTAGIVAIGKTATVRQYLRWQIVLGTATTVTFILAFVREKRDFT